MRVCRPFILAALALLCGCASETSLTRMTKGLRGPDVKESVRNLTNPDPETRRKAVVFLGERRQDDVVKLLCAVLEEDKDPLVRAGAADALGKIAHPSAIPSLVKALGDDRYMVRWDSVKALGEMKASPAIPNLERIARGDRQLDVRLAAISALGRIGGKDAIGPLIGLLGDKDENVVLACAQHLARLTSQSFGANQEKWAQWWDENRNKPLPPPVGATTKTSWWAWWRGHSDEAAAPAAVAPPQPPAPPEQKPAKSSGGWFGNLFKRSTPPPGKTTEPAAK